MNLVRNALWGTRVHLLIVRFHVPQSTRFYSTSPVSGPLHTYNSMVSNSTIRDDPHQRVALTKLQSLHDALQYYDPPLPIDPLEAKQSANKWKWIGKFLPKPQPVTIENIPTGIYLHGDVGCGKSFLMDLFYNTSPIPRKRRVHFHHFMIDIHQRLHKWRMNKSPQMQDPLPTLAAELTRNSFLLCFDEFQVTDVADAMILNSFYIQQTPH